MAQAPTRLTPLALAVLSLLHERPMHPYEMRQVMMHRRTDRVVKLRAGTLYHAVERLAGQGFIEPTETGRKGRRPERTIYALREAGRAVFVTQAADMLASPADEYPEYPLALELANDLPAEIVIDALANRIKEIENQLALDDTQIELVTTAGLARQYWLDLSYTRMVRQTELDWTKKLLDEVRNGRIDWEIDK